MTETNGRSFVAVVRLSTKGNRTLALPGQTCEHVPEASLSGLLRGGRIKPAERATKKPAPVKFAAKPTPRSDPNE